MPKIKICSIALAMILSIFLVSIASAQGVWTGNINVLLGAKALDKDDWEPADEQGEFGIEIDFREKNWPVNIAIDLLGATGEGTALEPFTGMFAKLESTTSEFNVGVRKIWEQYPHVRPFIGGGLSLIRGEGKVSVSGISVPDNDTGAGIWLGGGVYWALSEHFNLGLELKSSYAQVTLFDTDVNVGGGHFGLLAGYHW
ncbi:MAG: outer membrane beta-barrel protein [Nitrospirae bacterium]|nr:outer membrane beta-barrel protein [Nitrospirota bacterium]